MTSSRKHFVLDTNVFIHDPEEALTQFGGGNTVVICGTVINELDRLKKNRDDSIAYSARRAASVLDGCISTGDVCKGVDLPNGGTLVFNFKRDNPPQFDEDTPDNRILAFACDLQRSGKKVVVVSKDLFFIAKAAGLGLEFQDYPKDQSDLFTKYGSIFEDSDEAPNGILSVRYQVRGDDILRFQGRDCGIPIRRRRSVFGISPRNEEQECVIDALSRPEIETVALSGIAGSGKTFLALAVGLHQTIKSNPLYERVIVARPPVPVGRDIGYLPGDKEEKLSHWMNPITDNLAVIFHYAGSDNGNGLRKKLVEKGIAPTKENLVANGFLQIESIAHIRGRSLPHTLFIVDEAQNLRPLDVKTLVTRCGEGTKIVFCGDLGQIDVPYLNSRSSGLAHLIAKFKDEPDFCYIKLERSVRSNLAEKAARLL